MTSPADSLSGPLLVRSPNWLGDAVMALPAVRNLKTLIGHEVLAVATPEKLAALWQACPFVDQVIPLTQPKRLWTTAGEIRTGGKFTSAVLLPNSLRAAAEVFLARIPQRAGYSRDGRRALLTRGVPVPSLNPARMHQRYYFLDLAAALNAPADDSLPELRRPPVAESGAPLLALCPGAEYGPAKRWPLERFAAVARYFIDVHRMRVVLLGAASDAEVADQLIKVLPEAENLTGKTSLAEFMGSLAGAKLALCNDSGAMHLASVLGVPTVAIFGSTEPAMTGPLGPRTAILRHHVPCSPCFLRECPLDFACMTSITPEMVIAAAEKLIAA